MGQAWDEELRARGYRVTPQRQLVLEAVTKLEHATPEEICASVQQTARGVNISTIYRSSSNSWGSSPTPISATARRATTWPPRLSMSTWSAPSAAGSPRSGRTRYRHW